MEQEEAPADGWSLSVSRPVDSHLTLLTFLLLHLNPARRGTTVFNTQMFLHFHISAAYKSVSTTSWHYSTGSTDLHQTANSFQNAVPADEILSKVGLGSLCLGRKRRKIFGPAHTRPCQGNLQNQQSNKQTSQTTSINKSQAFSQTVVWWQTDWATSRHMESARCLTFVSLLVQHSTEATTSWHMMVI